MATRFFLFSSFSLGIYKKTFIKPMVGRHLLWGIVVRGRSQTTLTRVWLFLTTYPPAFTFSALKTLTKDWHFGTTYLPTVVCERPLMTLMYVWWVKIFFVDISLVISEIRNFFSGLFFRNSGIDMVIIFFFKHQLVILRVHSAGF